MMRGSAAAANPYAEDESITLPEGCFAEDVEMELHQADEPRSLTYGLGQLRQKSQHQHRAIHDHVESTLWRLAPYDMSSVSNAGCDWRLLAPACIYIYLSFATENGPYATLQPHHAHHAADEQVAPQPSPSHNVNADPSSKDPSNSGPSQSFFSFLPCCGNSEPDIEERFGRKFSLGERVADRVSSAVGSWTFVVTQSCILFSWIMFNIFFDHGPDPYPFILLNLMLSFQAAYTAPIIMMSQNRQSDIDREKAFDLHEKVDHIRLNQVWALWDQMQLQAKKLESMNENMEKVADTMLRHFQAHAQASAQEGANAETNVTTPITATSAGDTAAATAGGSLKHDVVSAALPVVAPIAAAAPAPCECRPPNMCDDCMYVLERADVGAALMQKSNPRYVPLLHPRSVPTTSFLPQSGAYSKPLDMAAANAFSPPQRMTRTSQRTQSQHNVHRTASLSPTRYASTRDFASEAQILQAAHTSTVAPLPSSTHETMSPVITSSAGTSKAIPSVAASPSGLPSSSTTTSSSDAIQPAIDPVRVTRTRNSSPKSNRDSRNEKLQHEPEEPMVRFHDATESAPHVTIGHRLHDPHKKGDPA